MQSPTKGVAFWERTGHLADQTGLVPPRIGWSYELQLTMATDLLSVRTSRSCPAWESRRRWCRRPGRTKTSGRLDVAAGYCPKLHGCLESIGPCCLLQTQTNFLSYRCRQTSSAGLVTADGWRGSQTPTGNLLSHLRQSHNSQSNVRSFSGGAALFFHSRSGVC